TARHLPRPFTVLATQNPIEYEGTYPLPEAQLDRFLLRTGNGYPTQEEEVEVLRRRVERGADELTLTPQASGEDLLRMRQAIESVEIDPDVARYIVEVVAATRASGRVQVGASPRGSLALLKLCRSRAALEGRTYVVPEDVKALAAPALAHRLSLRPELWVQRISGETVVAECLEAVPVPRAR
ncbi:MAG: MoxR family ATPase, partial [Candidatus Dormibacteraeota bacterium]|nr:MoxR family ATPase [Candidatus Dormibacteraeota bacterium]